ncbi:hypothetical protein [Corynebacterium sphenisci]|uniref:hypothetical protein n=1 Tax=Corynebacterium sphenisci TaxID=191493 RepID=UPI0026DEE6C4|nr:hypothetical protein [Corynebacterium sphenisci]MDO5731199.1 hypothetical protein [Corynebacterium sphenisci]
MTTTPALQAIATAETAGWDVRPHASAHIALEPEHGFLTALAAPGGSRLHSLTYESTSGGITRTRSLSSSAGTGGGLDPRDAAGLAEGLGLTDNPAVVDALQALAAGYQETPAAAFLMPPAAGWARTGSATAARELPGPGWVSVSVEPTLDEWGPGGELRLRWLPLAGQRDDPAVLAAVEEIRAIAETVAPVRVDAEDQ